MSQSPSASPNVIEKVEAIDAALAEMSESAFWHSTFQNDKISCTEISTSTMTSMFKTARAFGEASLDLLEYVRERFASETVTEETESMDESASDNEEDKSKIKVVDGFSLKETKMLNCVILRCDDGRKHYAIKVFSNGGLHITGCVTAGKALETALKVCTVIGAESVVNYDLQMLNTNFSVNSAIDLYKLAEIMPLPYKYNKDQHHALRFRMPIVVPVPAVVKRGRKPLGVSVLVFMSGSIILTGAKNPAHVFEAFKYIVDMIEVNFEQVKLDSYVRRKRKRAEVE